MRIIAIGVDDRVVYPALVLLHSLKQSTKAEFFVEVGFFEDHLSSESQALIAELAGLMEIPLRLQKFEFEESVFKGKRHITPTTFLKFLFAENIRGAFVWLDVDTVVKPGWDEIFEDLFDPLEGVQLVVAKKANPAATGFNAGVLGWPNGSPRKPWRDMVLARAQEGFSLEQDIFNSLYGDDVKLIPVEWNAVTLWRELASAMTREVRILHYAGPLKPWFLSEEQASGCVSSQCLWSDWFETEAELMKISSASALAVSLENYRVAARMSSSEYTRALPFFRLLQFAKSRPAFTMTKLVVRFLALIGVVDEVNVHPFHRKAQ